MNNRVGGGTAQQRALVRSMNRLDRRVYLLERGVLGRLWDRLRALVRGTTDGNW